MSEMTVTEFLTARIDEDEAEAERGRQHLGKVGFYTHWMTDKDIAGVYTGREPIAPDYRLDPERVLAQCAAMRKAIEAAWRDYMAVYNERGQGLDRDELASMGDAPEVVKALASIWSSHPDFREEWR